MTNIPMWLGFLVFVLLAAALTSLKRRIQKLRLEHEALARAMGVNLEPSFTTPARYVRKGKS